MNVSSHNNRSRHHSHSQNYRRRSATTNFNSSASSVLSGVVACLSGLDFDHKEELHAIITQLGGKYSGALDAGCGITHLIIDDPEGSVKYRFVQQILADDGKDDGDMMKKWAKQLRIVTSRWIEACAREGKRVDEKQFTLSSSQQLQHHGENNTHNLIDTNCNDDIANAETIQKSSLGLSLPNGISNDATLEEACEWFIQQQRQNDPYGLHQKQIFSMHSFLLVGFHSSNRPDNGSTNNEGNTIDNNDTNHKKHRRLHAKLSTLVRNAGGTIYWEPNEMTTIVVVNDEVDSVDGDSYNQEQLHHRHQERLHVFKEAKSYCQYHPRGPVAVTPRWILACIYKESFLDFPSSFPSPPPIPLPKILAIASKTKSTAANNVIKNDKSFKPAVSFAPKDAASTKSKRKYKQSTIFQGDVFIIIRPQHHSSSSLSSYLEYTQDEMESRITNAGGLILSKRILEAVKKDYARKKQEYAIQQRQNNVNSNGIVNTDSNDEKRRYYIVSPGGHSNIHHSKYHQLLGELSKILQQTSQLAGVATELSSLIEPVNPIWITACIEERYVYNPTQYPVLFQPQTYQLRLFPKDTKFLVSVTGFVDASRYGIIWMLRSLGAEYTDNLKAKNTHLICCAIANDENSNRNIVGGGAKYVKAKEWGLHVITVDWLYHCMRYGYEKGCEDKFLALRLEDNPKSTNKVEEKKSYDVPTRTSMDTNGIKNETVLIKPVITNSSTETAAPTPIVMSNSKCENDTLAMNDDESASPRRGKRDRKLPQASPVDNDSSKRFKSALETLQSTSPAGTASSQSSSSSSRRRRGKRDRTPRKNTSHQGDEVLSQESQESEYPQAETQFTIRADADIGKHWADSSGFDNDEAPLSQVNDAVDNGESQVVWLPFMRR